MRNTTTVQVPGTSDLDPEIIRHYVTKNYNLKDGDTVRVTRIAGLRTWKAEITWTTR